MCIMREPKWGHEAYVRLDFLPKEHKLLPTYNIKQDVLVVNQIWVKEENKKKIIVDNWEKLNFLFFIVQ